MPSTVGVSCMCQAAWSVYIVQSVDVWLKLWSCASLVARDPEPGTFPSGAAALSVKQFAVISNRLRHLPVVIHVVRSHFL